MAHTPNFAYQDPSAAIDDGLARAIFGDPQAAAAQRKAQEEAALRAAQAEQATQHAALYASQTTGRDGQNAASAGLPEMIARLSHPQTVPTLDDPAFLEGVGTAPPVPTADCPSSEHLAQGGARISGALALSGG